MQTNSKHNGIMKESFPYKLFAAASNFRLILLLVFSLIFLQDLSAQKKKQATFKAPWDKAMTNVVAKTDTAACTASADMKFADTVSFIYQISYPYFYNEGQTNPITDSANKYVRVVSGNTLLDSQDRTNLKFALKLEMDSLYKTWSRDLQGGFCYHFENSETISLAFADRNYLTLLNEWWAYDGGAHGVGGEDYVVLRSQTGQRIWSWKEIYPDTNRIIAIAKKEFYRLKKEELCDSVEWFWSGDFYLTDNFGILKDGITFYYQNYEIAPYVYGPTELFLSWDMLKPGKGKKKAGR